MSRTNIGRLLESANTVDLMLYIHDHPHCMKSEIYQNVTRNAHTSEKIKVLVNHGLITTVSSESKKPVFLSLTDTGNKIVDLLLQAEELLSHDESDQSA